MECVLLVDFGSTFTKLTLVNKNVPKIICRTKSHTTINTSAVEGYENALNKMKKMVDFSQIEIVKSLCCSSAAGGLKIVAIGITPTYTMEAARRVAMGAGGKIIGSFNYLLSDKDIDQIKKLNPDIILLAGGTEGGNKSYIVNNAKKLSEINLNIPLIIAGNTYAHKELKRVLKSIDSYYVDNIMPDTDLINPIDANDTIRNIFMKNIINAPGMDDVDKSIGKILMPTPTSVLTAANLLSKGTAVTEGIGELLIVDIGGATTDIHTMSDPITNKNYLYEGLGETFQKRTVEGDLGMRYSLDGVIEASDNGYFNSIEAKNIVDRIRENPFYLPCTEGEKYFDEIVAIECAKIAIERHAGFVKEKYLNGSYVNCQDGKDLTKIKYIIGTGGSIVNSSNPDNILKSISDSESRKLIPKKFQVLVDKNYILSAMGLLSTVDRDLAMNIMLDNLL